MGSDVAGDEEGEVPPPSCASAGQRLPWTGRHAIN
eukprot:CAMPEP_0176177124 /NCGR_PEP_ID=MMETSP0120_2-20121206/90740_1 /TAXON_ID=160619 /ORGANISM="Kryptoperidinium foliaceum, Strain CCMP 1326" /LENGTH=34 /DNA_ID= /DNA_START= /DNA_END= /DNA_ORIENTATION=